MDQLFNEAAGKMVAVTVVEVGPCYVSSLKTSERDGYSAVQVAFEHPHRLKKPLQGHLKKLPAGRFLREFRLRDDEEVSRFAVGDKITCAGFDIGDKLKVTGHVKGRGFQGVVKRYGFHGSPKSHGHKDQLRMPGSIGATDPAHVFKGTKMPGHMGDNRVTVAAVTVEKITPEKNLLFIKGALPGAINSLLMITSEGEMKVSRDRSISSDKKVANQGGIFNTQNSQETTVFAKQNLKDK